MEITGEIDRGSVPVATKVRGSIIVASLKQLRDRALLDRYRAVRDPRFARALDEAVPSAWLPAAAGRAHYEALDRLSLTGKEILSLGHGFSSGLYRPLLQMAGRLATGMHGATPWVVAPHARRMWPRLYGGGGDFIVSRKGEKEGDIAVLGFPFADVPYCRVAWRGIIAAGFDLFTRRATVREVPSGCDATSLRYHVYWP